MEHFFVGLGVLTFLLEVSILAGMYRSRSIARQSFLFAYCLAVALSCVAEWAMALTIDDYLRHPVFISYYFANEAVQQFLLYCLMIALIYQAWEGRRNRFAGSLLLAGGVLVMIACLLAFTRWNFNHAQIAAIMIAKATQFVSFASALLNLVLWTALFRTRRVSRELVWLSAGIGLQTAGKAIGYSIHRLNQSTSLAGTLITMGSLILCLVLWSMAFRSGRKQKVSAEIPSYSPAA